MQKVLGSPWSFYGTIVTSVAVILSSWLANSAQEAQGRSELSKQIALLGQKLETHMDSTADERNRLAEVEKIIYSITHNNAST